MSRDIKRVPLDFNAPIGEEWPGYVRPDTANLPTCPDCTGRGTTSASRWLEMVSQVVSMLADDYLDQQDGRQMHPYLARLMNAPTRECGRPSADIVPLMTGLAGEGPSFTGDYQYHKVYQAIVRAAGVGENWGLCPTCAGEGYVATAEQQAAYDAWKRTHPPTGDGWQMWETVSNGSPKSPVFPTAEALAEWLTTKAAGYDQVSTYEGALRFVRGGWAPSGAHVPGEGHMTGVEFAARPKSNTKPTK